MFVSPTFVGKFVTGIAVGLPVGWPGEMSRAPRTVVHLVEPKALKSAVLKGGQKAAKMAGSTASWKAVLRAALLDLWVD